MSELLTDQAEFNSPKREAVLRAIREIDFDSEKPFEQLFEIVPELKDLDFDSNHPVHPYSVLEHSVRAAQMATSDTVAIALLFHDIGKSLEQCQEWVDNTADPEAPQVLKSPEHEMWGPVMAGEIIRKYGLASDQDELDLIMDLTRYHDSWGHHFEDDRDGMIRNFDNKTIEYLFEVQELDLKNHSDDYYEKHIGELKTAQAKIRQAVQAKSVN